MKINKDIRTLEGEHNGYRFAFEAGSIEMFGRRWDRSEIKALLEVTNLLHFEGFEIMEKRPPVKKLTTWTLPLFDGFSSSDDAPNGGLI